MPREAFWLPPRDRIKVYASLGALAGVLILVVAFIAVFAAFTYPITEPDAKGRIYVGKAEQFQVGKPVPFPGDKFWLVKQEDGSFLALYSKSPYKGCSIPWRENFRFVDPQTGENKLGWFRDACHGSTWDVNGVRVFGPSPRNMDRFPVEVKGDKVYVRAVARLLIKGESAAGVPR